MRSDVGRYTPDLQTRTSAVTARRRDGACVKDCALSIALYCGQFRSSICRRRPKPSLFDRVFTALAVLSSLAATSIKELPPSSRWRSPESSWSVHGRFSFGILSLGPCPIC